MSDLFKELQKKVQSDGDVYSIEEFLNSCKQDKSLFATPAERLLKAIGDPKIVDTSLDPDRLGRIFFNQKIKVYESFEGFYGMENTIDEIVQFFKHASQGMEEKKQVLYLLGPVGGGKSSIAERLKKLMCQEPIYVLRHKESGVMSPVFESPLGLFFEQKEALEKEYKIDPNSVPMCPSPWAVKRLKEEGGDVNCFEVVKTYPSQVNRRAVAKVEPGDDNNQDIGSLVGKTDIRQLGLYEQSDSDAYSYSGGLCRANQGLLEFVEMFKAPIKVLHPLLTATQERNYNGTEDIGAIPFQGIILAHSNESEWESFSGNQSNEAFLDRVNLIRVPYCLRYEDEIKIYEKLIKTSSIEISDAPIAPKTLEMLAQFSVMSRLVEPENSKLWSKMKVYNGENMKSTDPAAKSLQEYKETAGINEGMDGMSTRFAFKVLSKTFNHDTEEVAANPVHLLYILDQSLKKLTLSDADRDKYETIQSYLRSEYGEFLKKELQKAYIEAYKSYGQNIFERYFRHADNYIQEKDFRDPETGEIMDLDSINTELEKLERPANISNVKDFRSEVVNYVLRYKANKGKLPEWTDYQVIRDVIEARIFKNMDEMLPVIRFDSKGSKEDKKKHHDFVERMKKRGYTEKQVKILVKWFESTNL